MSRARLRALRLVGFKSFADRTTVEFGPGISAVMGPNGSGKSNLADALRWALGEQGRTLRTRRAEDLIFAGSSTRKAQGMADVTLVIDNEDRLLPVDYGEIELGRRLFRSGENEYLLNRQKIRLRDLVDLLDEANLADNAFLFIGQGMVDQALALRPEERRPLFEEAAGIRKHERRRRSAEAELAEAETNLERVRDLLGELRPQAKRLAAQAEQQAQRRDAGAELAEGLVAVARERLGAAGEETRKQREALDAARADADAALAALRAAEEAAQAVGAAIDERAAVERDARTALEVARGQVVETRLAASRLAGDAQALGRDRERVAAEQAAIAVRLTAAARDLALPPVESDEASEEALREIERRLGDARRSLAEARESGRGDEERLRALRAGREARRSHAERLRRAADDAARRQREAAQALERAVAAAAAGAEARTATDAAARAAAEAEAAAETALEAAREAVAAAEATARDAAAREAEARAAVAATAARAAAIDALLATGRSEAAIVRIRSVGGRAIDVGLEVDPGLRRAVEAAFGEASAAHVVTTTAVPGLADLGGALVLADPPATRPARDRAAAAEEQRAAAIAEQATLAGGGPLAAALRRDPGGIGARLLATAVWVPDLPAALALVAGGMLAPGWRVATPAGELVTHDGVVHLAAGTSVLERRAERAELETRAAADAAAFAAASAAAVEVRTVHAAARSAGDAARTRLDEARRARRVADEADRAAVRRAEATARDAAWASTQAERLAAAAVAAEAEAVSIEAEVRADEGSDEGTGDRNERIKAEIAVLESRIASLDGERERLLGVVRAARARIDADRERRRKAELVEALDTARRDELDREVGRLAAAEADLVARREALGGATAAAQAEERAAADRVAAIEQGARDDRARLAEAERAAADARERLRIAEARSRSAEVRLLEVRVQLDAAREGLLVELAAIGPEGLVALRAVPGVARFAAPETPAGEDDRTAALEAALDAALESWRTAPPAREPAPGPGRLAALRRRYHDLGAGNPYAAEELAELTARLDGLEAQRADLETAIRSTREAIARLETLIADQFRTTFAQLEGAFARRFQQLFDGGEAQLSLTQPEDLGATGVEITARPPGKRRQPLAMLSGGERALTAVALLLAMLEVRPVPFCVLDEVDAALDEANVGRFSSALRGLSEGIQFIVITHNRGTIEAADALYGVTVGDDAVSRVISLRLGDRETAAEAMA